LIRLIGARKQSGGALRRLFFEALNRLYECRRKRPFIFCGVPPMLQDVGYGTFSKIADFH
jgi:hypothetical protein